MKKRFSSTIVLMMFNEKTIAANIGYIDLIVMKKNIRYADKTFFIL
jgi:hypothetical protein